MGVILWVLLATGWGVRGSLFFHVLPQPIDSATREVVLAPGGQVQWLTPVRGLTLTGRWRGLYHDSSRPWAPQSEWTSAYLRYQTRGFQMTLGRQFAFVEIGGLLDGASVRVQHNALALDALYGYRVQFSSKTATRWLNPDGERLWAFQIRYSLFPSSVLGIGTAKDWDPRETYQSPVWVFFQKWGMWSTHVELAYDIDQNAFSRIRLALSQRTPRTQWAVRYQFYGQGEVFRRLGWEEHDQTPDEEPWDPTHASQHRVVGVISVHGGIPVTFQGWVRFGRDFSGQGIQIQTRCRCLWFRAWLTGATDGDVQRGMEISVRHRVLPPLWLYLGGTLAASPPWSELWVEHFQMGFRWTPLSGLSVRGEFRIRSNPLLEYETRGYFYVDLPFEWRSTP